MNEVYYGISGSSALAASHEILSGLGAPLQRYIEIDPVTPVSASLDKTQYPHTSPEPPYGHLSIVEVEHQESELGDEDFYDPRVDEITPEYPPYEFKFNSKWVMGTGVVEATTSTRVRAVLSALREQAGYTAIANADEAQLSLRRLHTIGGTKIKLPSGEVVAKGQILSIRKAIDIAQVNLLRRLHPVAQVLSQFADQFPQVPSGSMHEINDQLIAATSYEQIRDLYKQAVYRLRHPHPEARRA